jgi:hypothetical protein
MLVTLGLLGLACNDSASDFSEHVGTGSGDVEQRAVDDEQEVAPVKHKEIEEALTAAEPVSIGGAFFTCVGQNPEAVAQDVRCSIESEKRFPWELMKVLIGEQDAQLSEVEFEQDSEGILFKWQPSMGYYVMMTYKERFWDTEIEFPTLSYISVECPFENDAGCFFFGDVGLSCTEVCEDKDGVDMEGLTFLGAALDNCTQVLAGLGTEDPYDFGIRTISVNAVDVGPGTVCGNETNDSEGGGRFARGRWYVPDDTITANGSEDSVRRACACNNGRSQIASDAK